MKQILLIPLLLVAAVALAACGAAPAAVEADAAQAVQQPSASAAEAAAPPLTETLVDEQGAVSVAVTPLNVDQGGATLDFEVAMNTHSVDLSMDLAGLATLATDAGQTVAAIAWDAPQGGHHVSGVLSFPAGAEGKDLLAGATQLTLSLRDVDAAERTFTWNLN